MTVYTIKGYDKQGRVRKPQWEMWFIYLAQVPVPIEGKVLVKVGVSSEPLVRLANVQVCCPFPIERAAFAPVGGAGMARGLERRVVNLFGERRTRGEWAMIDANGFDQLQREVTALHAKANGRHLSWRRTDGAQLTAVTTADRAAS